MMLLTPFDLITNTKEGLSIIFVGNAPSLNGEKLGEWIDSHDVVIRFNEQPKELMSDDVGIKTTFLVTNPYVEMRENKLKFDSDMTVIALFSQTRRGNKENFEQWLNGNQVMYSYSPDIVAVNNNKHFESLTTGTYGIQLFSKILKPESISVTGFTMFLGNTNFHYWSKKVPNGVKAHDFLVESKVFIEIINGFREKAKVMVTEDILWVSKKAKNKLKKKILVKKLINTRWRNESRSFWNFRHR
jgi:hypothetical protein